MAPVWGLFIFLIFCLSWRKKFFKMKSVLTTKGEYPMTKKLLFALFAVLTLAACTGSYRSGNCEYDFLLHKDLSVSKWIGSCN